MLRNATLAKLAALCALLVGTSREVLAELPFSARTAAILAPPNVALVPPDPLQDAAPEMDEGGVALAPAPSAIEQAWFQSTPLEARVDATRREALRLGVADYDAGARALLAAPGLAPPDQRAWLAVQLAPNLPAARMELARSLWLQRDAPLAAAAAALEALWRAPRHLEASLWLGGSAALALSRALVWGGLLGLFAAGAFVARNAVHDLGDLLPVRLPAVARAAFAAALWLLPALAGAGRLGLALPLALAAGASGGRGARTAVGAALLAIWLGAFPVARLAGDSLAILVQDPVVPAALSVVAGSAHLDDIQRLEASAPQDPLAERALAARARRHGRLGEADARYQRLLRLGRIDPALANNAANVRLDLGQLDSALALYERALAAGDSAPVYYNLAQAHGRGFQVEQLNLALARAQALDSDMVAELTRLQGERGVGFAVDLPLPVSALWERVLESEAGLPYAQELRAGLLPGALGREAGACGALFAAVSVAGMLLASRVRASRACAHCGRRVCPRCDEASRSADICAPCLRVFHPGEATQRELQAERIGELRLRARRMRRITKAASWLLPGCAAQLAGTPLRGLLACVAFAAVWAGLAGAPVADPFVMGLAAPLSLWLFSAAAGIAYLAMLAGALTRLARSELA